MFQSFVLISTKIETNLQNCCLIVWYIISTKKDISTIKLFSNNIIDDDYV